MIWPFKRIWLWVWVFLSLFSLNIQICLAEIDFLKIKGTHALFHPEFEYLSPIHGFNLLKTGVLKRMRFYGRYEKRPDSPEFSFSNDSTSAFIQVLFPSPDGVLIVANQIPSDPVSHFTPTILGKILNRMSNITPEELDHPESLENEFIEIAFHEMDQTSYSNRLKQKVSKLQSQINRIKNKGSKNLSPVEIQKSENQIATLRERLEVMKQRLQEAEPQQTVSTDLKANWRERDFKKFANTLVGAIIESRGHSPTYPNHFPEQLLLAFMWAKMTEKGDILKLLKEVPFALSELGNQVLTDVKNQDVYLDPKNSYDHEELQSWMKLNRQKTDPDFARAILENIEMSSVYIYYEEILNQKMAPVFNYSKASYVDPVTANKIEYPDCGEASLRNFFNFLIYSPQMKILDVRILNWVAEKHSLTLSEGLVNFYVQFPQISGLAETRLNDEWSNNVVSNLTDPPVIYRKPEIRPVCEIRSGMRNMLAVIENLLFKSEAHFSQMSPSEKWDRICQVFSRPGFELDWRVKGFSKELVDSNDVGFDLEFLVNEKPMLEWRFFSGHFAVSKNSPFPLGWRTRLADTIVEPSLNVPYSLLPWFINISQYQSLLYREKLWKPAVFFKPLLFALPFDSNQDKVQIISTILQYKRKALYPTALKLIEENPFQNMNQAADIFDAVLAEGGEFWFSVNMFLQQWLEDPRQRSELFKISVTRGKAFLFKHILKDFSIEEVVDFKTRKNLFCDSISYSNNDQNYEMIAKVFIEKLPASYLNKKLCSGSTPLYWIVKYNRMNLLAPLMAKLTSQQMQRKHWGNMTVLHEAAKKPDADMLEVLLEKIPSDQLDPQTFFGRTPLHLAAWEGSVETIERLLQSMSIEQARQRDHFGANPVHTMSGRRTVEIRMLVKALGSHTLGEMMFGGFTPLHLMARDTSGAFYKGMVNLVPYEELIKKTWGGWTPLHFAASFNNQETLLVLIERLSQSDLHIKDAFGKTALDIALDRAHPEIAFHLIQALPSDQIPFKNAFGETLIHRAAKVNSAALMELIFQKMADKQTYLADWLGRTPLHVAANQFNFRSAEVLANRAVAENFNRKDVFGRTPVEVAEKKRNRTVVDIYRKQLKRLNVVSNALPKPIRQFKVTQKPLAPKRAFY